MPSLTGLSEHSFGQRSAPAAPSASMNSAPFSFATLPAPAAAPQLQQQQPAPTATPADTAAPSSGPPPSASTPMGAAPVPGGASLQLSAPSTTAGLQVLRL